jgi:hypothetical protein
MPDLVLTHRIRCLAKPVMVLLVLFVIGLVPPAHSRKPSLLAAVKLAAKAALSSTRHVVYVPGTTRKLCQLTGEFDLERQQFTLNRTESRVGLAGTDLGVSFEHNGRLYFLFGDTWPTEGAGYNSYRPRDGDSIASTLDTNPEDCIDLQFVTAPDGWYLSPQVPGISLGNFEVPIAGFSANGKMYVFFSTDHSEQQVMGRTVLASLSDDEARSPFHYVYEASRDKFINISPVIVNNADIPGLPDRQGQGLLMWGSGRYRQSDPYLAYVPLSTVEDKQTWRYFAGMEAGSLQPVWSTKESDAMPLFVQPCIGELSVAWNSFLQKWLMLYNCDSPRGINFRVADQPWGPWSPPAVLFDPWADGGYCHFMHADSCECDSVYDSMFDSDRPRQWEWGGEYGPYQIPRYTTGDATSTTIYYTMSTWNPYQVVLMKSTLRLEPTGQAMTATGGLSFIQRRFGCKGNFEVVVPRSGGGLAHYWRDNDSPELPWHGPVVFGTSAGHIDAVALIQSNFGAPGNLEVVARAGNRLIFFWRDAADWHGPYPLIADGYEVTGVTGNPALIQSRFGRRGNFEVVVPRSGGGLAHYWRDNDSPELPWHGPVVFGTSAGHIDAVALIQSNFGEAGNLEVIARIGGQLAHFWWDTALRKQWQGPFFLPLN